MSNTTLLIVLTLLIFVSGMFLTSGWHKYLMTRRKRKESEQANKSSV